MYQNNYNAHEKALFNRLTGAWKALPEPLKVVSGIVGIAGVLTVGKRLFKRLNKSGSKINGSEADKKTLPTVESTAREPLEDNVNEPLNKVTDDEIDAELIRMTMSKLGKRSAEKRRLSKLNSE